MVPGEVQLHDVIAIKARINNVENLEVIVQLGILGRSQ